MSKLNQLLMQKSKNFYMFEKKKGCSINVAGLLFTEEEAISRWVNRSATYIKLKLPTNFNKLETFDRDHALECFHNLDVDIINAETKALHYSAHIFYEKAEVKEKLHSLLNKFATVKDF